MILRRTYVVARSRPDDVFRYGLGFFLGTCVGSYLLQTDAWSVLGAAGIAMAVFGKVLQKKRDERDRIIRRLERQLGME